jgi:aminoglycoside 6-adenylyltransferase
MNAAEQILSNAVKWASGQDNVRCLVLVGSRARSVAPDGLADIDLQVYAENNEPYTRRDAWLTEIGEVWLSVPDQYADGDIVVSTRLVIFNCGVKVDFAFYPAGSTSHDVRTGLPHRILVDKDVGARPDKAGYVASERSDPPGESEFLRDVEEFWFEVYHVAKYLVRDELWLAKERDWAAKHFLLNVIGWHGRIVQRRAYHASHAGQRAAVGDDTWAILPQTFCGFEREEGWEALIATTKLFRRLAKDVADAIGCSYPVAVDTNVTRFILELRDRGRYLSDRCG